LSANSKVVSRKAAPSAALAPPTRRAPKPSVSATSAIPASADGSRAAASVTCPSGAPATAASQ
jgi:hypothetical protein